MAESCLKNRGAERLQVLAVAVVAMVADMLEQVLAVAVVDTSQSLSVRLA